ncbi:MAG: nucleic acid-binding protein [Anabaena sp. LE011-02]|jgi:predicted nucleic acid-binding protein|nr:MAG: nucleic acid-binding protein [Anabaena sp. LE011-02]
MRQIFADTFYWIALCNQRDQWHQQVVNFSQQLKGAKLVTSDAVLNELLNYYAQFGSEMRLGISQRAREILRSKNIQVITHTREVFIEGLDLYANRLDKGYSLTDCMSMIIMERLKITEILTHDKHFTQEGFLILFQEERNA